MTPNCPSDQRGAAFHSPDDDAPFRPRTMLKSHLALMYFPHSTPHAATQVLRRWMNRCGPMQEELRALGYDRHRKYLLSREVAVVVRHLGDP